MAAERIVIIGAGFAGLSAARFLRKYGDSLDVSVIDRNENTHFRPLIPDTVSRTVYPGNLLYPVSAYADRFGFTFIHGDVSGIDFDTHSISLDGFGIGFDYCIIAAGSQTPLPPSERLRLHAVRFDTIYDAERIRHAVLRGGYERIIVCGGGYTGVELAFHLRKLIAAGARPQKVIIVEMMDRIIGTLPEWMQSYTRENIERESIEVMPRTRVEDIDGRDVRLSSGKVAGNALCIWTTGLAAPPATARWNVPRGHAGRIIVDATLRFRERCFAAGDIACIGEMKRCSRMSVQFALDQGALAARNSIAHSRGKPPACFKSRDLGFIIPMVNGRSCGEALGIRVKGLPATVLHYLLSLYRTPGFINRAGVFAGLVRILATAVPSNRRCC